ncbi:hypothetical protein [Serratia sp. M24T3]|uniref:hypothetical protein n=1 Tax=Serratia sp. M24T3 TaxID=932213 RepID=UPI00025B8F31|nr:hypothetical protein [Serratia sp. M24T3]EIC83975.1 hypothetical protein SPM24T3_13700 [Serratia sp. M24T3]
MIKIVSYYLLNAMLLLSVPTLASAQSREAAITLPPENMLCVEAAEFYMATCSAAFGIPDQNGTNGRDTAMYYGKNAFKMTSSQVDSVIAYFTQNKDIAQQAVKAIYAGKEAQNAFSASYTDTCLLAPQKYIPNYQALVAAGLATKPN